MLLRRLFFLAVSIYLGIVLIMWLLENTFIYPAPRYPVGFWDTQSESIEEASFTANDGTNLHGWFIDHPDPRGTLLYFHGNGENISFLAPMLQTLNSQYRLRVMAFDYRGYGKSQGKPSEAGIYLDSRAALDWLNRRTGTSPGDVILHGRSIGGGIALELAADKGCKALVLENTFTSLPDTAAYHFPWIPVHLVMRNRYPSLERIQVYKGPLLQAHGEADNVVPFELGQRLFDASQSANKQFLKFKDMDHNDPTPQEFWDAFDKMLTDLDSQ